MNDFSSSLVSGASPASEHTFISASTKTSDTRAITTGPFELASLPEIQVHLAFLCAFTRLKAQVKSQSGPVIRHSADELWAIYVAQAVDRFALWLERMLSKLGGSEPREFTENEAPPLDVLMAWHTYMLNPRVFFEDGLRGKSRLLGIRFARYPSSNPPFTANAR